jgi:hypothetical protein
MRRRNVIPLGTLAEWAIFLAIVVYTWHVW